MGAFQIVAVSATSWARGSDETPRSGQYHLQDTAGHCRSGELGVAPGTNLVRQENLNGWVVCQSTQSLC